MSDKRRAEQVAEVLDSLDSPTIEQVSTAAREFDADDVAAAAAHKALDGGGSLPVPITAGSGSPVGVVTPSQLGELYIDTDGGGIYIAATVADSDHWVQLGGDVLVSNPNTGETAGQFGNSSNTVILAKGGFAALSDVANFDGDGAGNGIYWQAETSIAQVRTGDSGQHAATLQDENGTMTLADGGLIFPTSDPGVAGAWWDNNGVLTKSTGP